MEVDHAYRNTLYPLPARVVHAAFRLLPHVMVQVAPIHFLIT